MGTTVKPVGAKCTTTLFGNPQNQVLLLGSMQRRKPSVWKSPAFQQQPTTPYILRFKGADIVLK